MTTSRSETTKRPLISLLYIDNLKVYDIYSDQLDGQLHTICTFSDDIQTKSCLDKCSVAHFVNGQALWCVIDFIYLINLLNVKRIQSQKYYLLITVKHLSLLICDLEVPNMLF